MGLERIHNGLWTCHCDYCDAVTYIPTESVSTARAMMRNEFKWSRVDYIATAPHYTYICYKCKEKSNGHI